MAGSEEKRDSAMAPSAPDPGPLSRLIQELADAPGDAVLEAWKNELQPGDRVGRFEIRREVGRGGFGAVYEAFDTELNRIVAVKALRLSRSRRDLSTDWLKKEAEAVARLDHPCIVTLFDVGTCPSGPYLVMELLRGGTLAQRLDEGPVPIGEALRIAEGIARGLAHAHQRGVLHRDLKPANVFLCDDDRVKLLDFGLAHLLGKPGEASGGTPAYMAPEQARGDEIDARADVHAAALTLREMVTGKREPGVGAPIPRALARVLDLGASPDREDRPRDGTAWRDEIREVQRSLAKPRAVRRVAGLVLAGLLAGTVVAGAILERRSAGRIVGLAPGPGERIPVAVADVVNETGEKELDVLSGLLVTSLEQSRRLTVMTQARVLDLASRAGRPDAVRVDETIGREVGRAHGIRALLLPAIRRLGTTYSLEMRVIDPGRDEHLFTLSDRATSKEALLDLLDRLSERTRAGLGEGKDEVARASVQLGEAMTRSLDAYQHYLAGQEAWLRDGLRAVGLAEFREALRLDPGFAPAHGDLAELLQSYGRSDLAEVHWRAASENLERTPAKERHVLKLRRAYGTEARQLAEEAVLRYPADKHVLAEAADAFEVLALPEQRDSALRTALELDPAYWAAARLLSARLAQRTDAALAVARRAVATRRSAVNLTLLAEGLHATGATNEGSAAAREALARDGGRSSLVSERACFVLWQSRSDAECQGVWDRMKAEATEPMERDAATANIVVSLFVKGRVREARRLAALLEEPEQRGSTRVTYMHTIGYDRAHPPADALAQARRIPTPMTRRNFLAWLGAMEEAERVDETLRDRSAWGGVAQQIYEATRLATEKRFAEAAKLARNAYEVAQSWNAPAWVWSRAAFTSEMLLADGRPGDVLAIQAPTLPCRCRDPVDYAASYPSFALYRARAMEQLGRPGDAARELDGVIAFWKEADDDLPLLVEAKAMRARLARSAFVDGARP